MQIAEAFVAIRAQVNPSQFKGDIQRGIEAPMTQAAGQAGKKAGQAAGKGVGDGLASQASKVRSSLASLFAGAVFARGVKGAIDAASALQEQVSATGQIFGDAGEDVDAFAKSAAQALGQSEVEARKATNVFGALFRSFGTSETQAAQFGITLSTLASDLASFRDTPIEDAFTALQSGLVGEAEPLRRFGVSLSEARLQAEAMSLGLVKSKGPLDARAKAQAALSIILKDTTLAQGDFNRTRDSAANTERRAAAEIANTSAKLGQNLLPAYQRLQQTIGTVANAFGSLPGPIQTSLIALAGLAVAAKPAKDLGVLIGGLKTKFTDAAGGAGRMAGAAKALGTATLGIGAAATSATALLSLYESLGGRAPSVERLTTATEALAKSGIFGGALEESFGESGQNFKKQVELASDALELDTRGVVGGVGKIGVAISDVFGGTGATELQDAKKDFQNLDAALAELVSGGNADQAAAAFTELRRLAKEQGVDISSLVALLPQYQAALGDVDLQTQAGTKSGDVYKDGLNAIGSEASATTSKLSDLADSLFATQDAQLDAADAVDDLHTAQADLNELRETAAGRGPAQAAAQERIADATRRVTDATEAQADAVQSLQDARQELAEFESGTSQRIRSLEREQIVRRVVTTPEEARQKELDLLKFDQQAGQERERLQDGIADAEERVRDAADAVKDAQDDVKKANQERERQQVEAAGKIAEAEREVQRAAMDIATAYADIVDKQGASSAAAQAYRDALKEAEPVLRNIVDLNALLAASPASAGLIGPSPEAAAAIRAGKPGGIGIFQAGGIVPGTGPQLAVVHGGETITPAGQAAGGVSLTMQNTFVGGDVPTVTQLDAIARKTAIRVRNLGRKP